MGVWNVSQMSVYTDCAVLSGWDYRRANERMSAYKPAEHEGTTGVAPLLQFFELVHVGDTIQSMVQVFFDKEIVRGFPFVGRFVCVR